jgi:hypothetical protein
VRLKIPIGLVSLIHLVLHFIEANALAVRTNLAMTEQELEGRKG